MLPPAAESTTHQLPPLVHGIEHIHSQCQVVNDIDVVIVAENSSKCIELKLIAFACIVVVCPRSLPALSLSLDVAYFSHLETRP